MGIIEITFILTLLSSIFIFFIIKCLEFALKKSIMKYIILSSLTVGIILYITFYIFVSQTKYDGCGGFLFLPILIFILVVTLLLFIFVIIEKLYKKLNN